VSDAFSSRWPAAMLVGLGTPWNTLRLDGQLLLNSPGFSVAWHSGRPRLMGDPHRSARPGHPGVHPATAGQLPRRPARPGRPRRGHLSLSTIKGGLLLQGQGQWVGGRLRFRGDARAAPGQELALANLLSIIGRRDGQRSLLTFG
jgi:general secretion pathway protein N